MQNRKAARRYVFYGSGRRLCHPDNGPCAAALWQEEGLNGAFTHHWWLTRGTLATTVGGTIFLLACRPAPPLFACYLHWRKKGAATEENRALLIAITCTTAGMTADLHRQTARDHEKLYARPTSWMPQGVVPAAVTSFSLCGSAANKGDYSIKVTTSLNGWR